MAVAICPGSFDPPTNGHIDVVERSAVHFEQVVVVVVDNPAKKTMFAPEERSGMLKQALEHLPNVEIMCFEGLLVDLARERRVDVIVKGLRAISDLEYELQMAQMNASMLEALDTFFVATNPKWSFISSSLVKEVAGYGGDVSALVPAGVNQALAKRFRQQ